jgi:hypothetical protein
LNMTTKTQYAQAVTRVNPRNEDGGAGVGVVWLRSKEYAEVSNWLDVTISRGNWCQVARTHKDGGWHVVRAGKS